MQSRGEGEHFDYGKTCTDFQETTSQSVFLTLPNERVQVSYLAATPDAPPSEGIAQDHSSSGTDINTSSSPYSGDVSTKLIIFGQR